MARVCEDPTTAKYAGEKFLHSAILLIQGLLVLYLRDTVVEQEWVKTWPNLILVVKLIATGLLGIVTAAASWAWFFGYSELNVFLWDNWKRRIDAINASSKPTKTPEDQKSEVQGASKDIPPATGGL